MKKAMIVLLTSAALLAGCGASDSSASPVSLKETSYPKSAPASYQSFVQVEGDRIIHHSFSELEAASELIVVGEFAEDTQQEATYKYSEEFGKDILTDAVSRNVIAVSKVIKGEAPDRINISQRYGISDSGELTAFSGLPPMKKGDKRIFFLKYDKENDTYWCEGDFTGRYPVPDEKLLAAANEISEAQTELDKWTEEHRSEISDSGYTPEQQEKVDSLEARITTALAPFSPADLDVLDSKDLRLKAGIYAEVVKAYRDSF